MYYIKQKPIIENNLEFFMHNRKLCSILQNITKCTTVKILKLWIPTEINNFQEIKNCCISK